MVLEGTDLVGWQEKQRVPFLDHLSCLDQQQLELLSAFRRGLDSELALGAESSSNLNAV